MTTTLEIGSICVYRGEGGGGGGRGGVDSS